MTNLSKIKMFIANLEFRFSELRLYLFNKQYKRGLKISDEALEFLGGVR